MHSERGVRALLARAAFGVAASSLAALAPDPAFFLDDPRHQRAARILLVVLLHRLGHLAADHRPDDAAYHRAAAEPCHENGRGHAESGTVNGVFLGDLDKDSGNLLIVDMLGKTDQRQLIQLAYHSVGGIGPTTFLQHIYAAFEKPYVCVLGGREPVSWVQYPAQTTLHSIGSLDCCSTRACWKSRTVKLDDGKNDSLCSQPVLADGVYSPRCMSIIKPEEVAYAIERYIGGRVPLV